MPSYTLAEVARLVGGELVGDAARRIDGVNGLESATDTQLSFLLGPKLRPAAGASKAAGILVRAKEDLPHAQIVVPQVRTALARVAALFLVGREREPAGFHPTSVVSGDAVLGEGAGVGPFCRVGRGVRIGRNSSIAERCSLGDGVVLGDDVMLHPGVTIYPGCRIGSRVEIHTGAVIGVDGYSIVLGEGVPEKVPSLGTVEIQDDVEIFSNVTIARGAFDRTVIGRWSKIDCLCHIGHNCRFGQGVIVAAFGGVSGSVEVGDGAILGGMVGVVDHVKIGKGAQIGAGSGIEHNVGDGEQMWGRPAKPIKQELKLQAVLKRLPEAWRTLQKVIKREEAGSGEA